MAFTRLPCSIAKQCGAVPLWSVQLFQTTAMQCRSERKPSGSWHFSQHAPCRGMTRLHAGSVPSSRQGLEHGTGRQGVKNSDIALPDKAVLD
jgi:hypothetical protein